MVLDILVHLVYNIYISCSITNWSYGYLLRKQLQQQHRNHIAYLRRRLERAEDELGTCEPERSERAAVVYTNRIHSPAACQLIA